MINKTTISYFLIPFFAIFAPFFQALDVLGISFWYKEVLIFSGLLLGFSFFTTTALLVGGGRLRILILAAITLALLDVMIGGWTLMDSVAPVRDDENWFLSREIKTAVFLAFVGVTYLVLWILRQHVTTILATVFGAIFLTTIILHPVLLPDQLFANKNANRISDSTSASAHLPIVVHIVFDELMAPGAMSVRGQPGKDVAAVMKDFSEKFEFRLYGRVYSRHYHTGHSLVAMFSYDLTSLETVWSSNQKTTKWTNAYFDEMTKRGYKIRVYQTAHVIDFCAHSNVIVCETLNPFNPLSEYVRSDFKQLKLKHTSGIILGAFLQSFASRTSAYLLKKLIGVWPSRYDVQAFPLWFEKFSGEIIHAPRGTMIFAHILVPHAPFMLSGNCELNEQELIPYDLGEKYGFNLQTAALHKIFYEQYFAQVKCVFKKLATLLHKIEESGRFKDAIIVIHGDHGSRISLSHHLETMSQEDFIDNYPAYFAIRGPGIEPGYDDKFVSLQRLFAEYFAPESLREEQKAHDGLVVVDTKGPKEVVEVAMPVFGAARKDLPKGGQEQ